MIFLDIESDHPIPFAEPDPFTDRAVSICLIETGTRWIESDFAEPAQRSRLINPGFSLNRSEIHGITDEQIKDAPRFAAIAKDLHALVSRHEVIVTFNGIRYDVPLLWSEFDRAGIEWDTAKHKMVDLSVLWRKAEQRSLSDAVQRFLAREHEGAHTAEADTGALVDLLPHFLGLAAEAGIITEGAPLDEVAALCKPTIKIRGDECEIADLGGNLAWDDGRLVFTMRRAKGVAVEDDPGLGAWMLRQEFVPPDAKRMIRQAIDQEQPQRRKSA